MNKSELIDQIAAEADMSKAGAGRALDAAVAAVKQASRSPVGQCARNNRRRAARILACALNIERIAANEAY